MFDRRSLLMELEFSYGRVHRHKAMWNGREREVVSEREEDRERRMISLGGWLIVEEEAHQGNKTATEDA